MIGVTLVVPLGLWECLVSRPLTQTPTHRPRGVFAAPSECEGNLIDSETLSVTECIRIRWGIVVRA